MTARRSTANLHTRRRVFGVTLMLAVIGAFLVGIWFLSADARRELDALATANSESSQWSIAQSEVELLTLESAILFAMREDTPEALAAVRRRFDVFYSRMHTLQRSTLLEPVLDETAPGEAVVRIIDRLDGAIALIDGSDADLRAGMEGLLDMVVAARRDLRFVSLESVRISSVIAEEQRGRVANALRDLAVLTFTLVMVLIALVLALVWSLSLGRRRTAEIARAQNRLRTVVDTSLDGVLVVGRDGRILDFNGAAERIFGYSQREALGAEMADLIIPDHLKKAHRAGMDRFLDTGRLQALGKGLVQMEARDKTGRVFPVELSLATAESEEGAILVSFIRDISSRLAAERELVDARDKALAGEEAKAEFLAVMSHEMRTPLNGVLGGLDLLSGTDLSERQRGFVEIMDRSGRMLLHHVNAVLDIARDDAGKTILRPEPFDPIQLLQDIADSQSVQAETRGNRLSVMGMDQTGTVIGDRSRLSQVIVNLVANAVKFTRNGQITLSFSRLDEDGLVEFRVADTGIGIPAADQPRIFDDFVTLDTRYTRDVEGTGLGLGIARRLVEAMGGKIGVTSTPGTGSEFWLQLPLPSLPGGVPDLQITPTQPRRQPLRVDGDLPVLIVEDNDINRLILREMLAEIGCQAIEASDGVEAETLAASQSFALILMDISMPRKDGVEATLTIRDTGGLNEATPIIALTAHALPSEVERFYAAGMNEVLVKPLTQSALIDLFERFFPGRLIELGPAEEPDDRRIDPTLLLRAKDELQAHLARIETVLAQQDDLEEVVQIAHKAAGLSAVIGLPDLQNVFITLELAVEEVDLEEGELEALTDMLSEARQLFQQV